MGVQNLGVQSRSPRYLAHHGKEIDRWRGHPPRDKTGGGKKQKSEFEGLFQEFDEDSAEEPEEQDSDPSAGVAYS